MFIHPYSFVERTKIKELYVLRQKRKMKLVMSSVLTGVEM